MSKDNGQSSTSESTETQPSQQQDQQQQQEEQDEEQQQQHQQGEEQQEQSAASASAAAPPPMAENDWSDGDLNGDGGDENGMDAGLLSNSPEAQSLDDDPITSLAYLQRSGASSNGSERQNAVRNIVKTLQNVEHDEAAVQVVFNLVSKTFATDGDAVVRGELLEQLPMICMHCSQTPELQTYMKEVLLPLLVKFLNDPSTQVRKTCQAAILILIEQGLMMSEDIEELIYPELEKLSESRFPDDVRIEAVCLLCKLVTPLGRESTIKLFLNKFTELCQDSLFHIRKTCASHMGEMSRILGQEVTEKLLVPHLISLSQDSVWGVRKTCAECFTDISFNCAMQTRRHQLAPVFIVLLSDNSRWVQCSAFQALGQFISTFADSDRTGLKWVEGELVYNEPKMSDYMQQHSDYVTSTLMELSKKQQQHQHQQQNASGGGHHGGKSDGSTTASAGHGEMENENDEDDMDMNLQSLLDDNAPENYGTTSPAAAITSNIAQLAQQRLNGDLGRSESSTAAANPSESCIVDLSGSVLPPTAPSILDEQGKKGEDDEEKETEFNAFKYWKPSYYTICDPATIGEVGGDEDLPSPGGGEDPEYRKFMERHTLGVVGGGSREDEPGNEGSPREAKSSDSESNGNETGGSTMSEEGEESKETVVVKEDTTSPDAVPARVQRQQSGSTGEYVSFASQGRHTMSSIDSPEPMPPPKGFEYQDIIPQALLDQFLSMVEPSRAQAIESDISRHCAFNLPAVAFTIGRRHWPLIKPTYLALANDMQWKVRRTLAFSIHELAAILGPELTVQDLLPVFSGFLRDLDEVRIGILRHLYDFLKLLNKEVRRSLLPSLADFLQADNYRSWRFRHLFAEQLIQLCDLFDIEDINDYLSPIAMTLAIDKIAEIRHVTHRLLATILRCFYKVEAGRSEMCDITDSFVQDIVKGFAKSQRWVRRQTFVYVCREVVRTFAIPESKFATSLLPPLVSLAQDNIPNVRIVLASLFAEMYYICSAYLTEPELVKRVSEIVKSLATDRDRDVRLNANFGLGDATTMIEGGMLGLTMMEHRGRAEGEIDLDDDDDEDASIDY